MFDFENLEVYKKAKAFNATVGRSVLKIETLDAVIKNQLRRASLSVVLNIAEGTSRFSKPDRKNFCIIARGSVFECVAVFDILREMVIYLIQISAIYIQSPKKCLKCYSQSSKIWKNNARSLSGFSFIPLVEYRT